MLEDQLLRAPTPMHACFACWLWTLEARQGPSSFPRPSVLLLLAFLPVEPSLRRVKQLCTRDSDPAAAALFNKCA